MVSDERPQHEFIGRKLSMTTKVARTYAEQQMSGAGTNLTTAIVTRILAREPGLAQGQLAERMGVEGPTMARHIDRMERDGIVTRERDAADRRVLRVHLTDRGHRMHERLIDVSTATHESLTDVFSPTELARFNEYLDRLAARASVLIDEHRSVS